MRCFVMFVSAVCILFLLKLKWPKNKSLSILVLDRVWSLRSGLVLALLFFENSSLSMSPSTKAFNKAFDIGLI